MFSGFRSRYTTPWRRRPQSGDGGEGTHDLVQSIESGGDLGAEEFGHVLGEFLHPGEVEEELSSSRIVEKEVELGVCLPERERERETGRERVREAGRWRHTWKA
jgi:hypothetical protein